MTGTTCIGWDIGGAHLKLARFSADGTLVCANQYATPLWRGLETLELQFAEVRDEADNADANHALTMTGELVDHFPDRQTGVGRLLDAFFGFFPSARTSVFAGAMGFLPESAARREAGRVASANWFATARCVAQTVTNGVLLDVGSTTTDIVPMRDGMPCNRGWTDQERLQHDELVYTGVVRTPVMALVRRVPVHDRWQNVMAECFATAADVYRITGELGVTADLHETADQRGKSVPESMARLARMVGAEVGSGDANTWRTLADHIADRQLQMLERALARVTAGLEQDLPITVVGTGAGEFLARKLAHRAGHQYAGFADLFVVDGVARHDIDTCAPAVAVASLLRQGILQ